MTALLTADEAARLRVGEQLVIVRSGRHWVCSCGMATPKHNCPRDDWREITRPWDGFVAPQAWVALTGPCPTCGGKRLIEIHPESAVAEMFYAEHPEHRPKVPFYFDCPDCRDGRRIVPLYRDEWSWNSDGTVAERVLAGRVSIEVDPEPDGRNWRIVIDCVEVA